MLALFGFIFNSFAISAERNVVSGVYANGAIVKLMDGSVYEISPSDADKVITWHKGDEVFVTSDKIINRDNDDRVDYVRQVK